MRNDITKLRVRKRGYLIVFSANPPELTDKNVADLPLEVGGLDVSAKEHRFFHTENLRGDPIHFWLAGWPLSSAGANI